MIEHLNLKRVFENNKLDKMLSSIITCLLKFYLSISEYLKDKIGDGKLMVTYLYSTCRVLDLIPK